MALKHRPPPVQWLSISLCRAHIEKSDSAPALLKGHSCLGVTKFTARKPQVFSTWAGPLCKFIICIWVVSPGNRHFWNQVKNQNNSSCPAGKKISPGTFHNWICEKQGKQKGWSNDQEHGNSSWNNSLSSTARLVVRNAIYWAETGPRAF